MEQLREVGQAMVKHYVKLDEELQELKRQDPVDQAKVDAKQAEMDKLQQEAEKVQASYMKIQTAVERQLAIEE